ncbi:hypothetical protein C4K14_5816 [Pseudomonas chlororaphis subsp. aureofaciens]|nr:hypothetical protein C4K14_5816 [Pseudomonas chlororaphis subsp. aureofaciens]
MNEERAKPGPGHARRRHLIAINACVRKKPDCLELERSRVTGKATSMAGQGPASQG